MNKHKEFYKAIERELVDKKERVSLKQLEYYIKNGTAYYYPKRFSITELKYFILELINSSINKDMTIKEKVSPKAGRLLFFDGSILHTGSHPVLSKYRMCVNIDLTEEAQ